ncbi:hypothetical protein F5Y17DRAFT_416530 [Xylariaceae sp. FL0594]|nr:hypothetical protein F5Y17DRAFT_416530 [Xylariaceae sp. FL0594]
MSIQWLPDEAIAQIKSSATIASLNGVVNGLICNSLDSGATKITVSVDYERGNCTVEDDGMGISPAEFKPGGSLGRLYYTSKYPAGNNVHGRYGSFLASLASLSLLSITSHHKGYLSHNSIRIHNSHVLSRHTPSPPDQRVLTFAHGTRVTVRDLFGSLPVRVKQRAVDAERGSHSRDWEALKRSIVALALSWSGHISISCRESRSCWPFTIRGNDIELVDGFRGPDLAARTSKILFQAGLSDASNLETWIPLRASAGTISLFGAVSLRPVATRRVQFISIGVRPVPNEHGSNILYEEVNRIFSNSAYGEEDEVANLPTHERERRAEDGRYKNDGFTKQELRGRKGIDRWPMFYIRIQYTCHNESIASQEVDDILSERHDSLAAIVAILKAVTYEFLKKYHFRPKRATNRQTHALNRCSMSASPRTIPGNAAREPSSATRLPKRQLNGDLATTQLSIACNENSRSRPTSPFDLWARVKHGSPHRNNSHSGADAPSSDTDAKLLQPAFPDRAGKEQTSGAIGTRGELGIRWANPATNEISVLDPRAGFIKRSKLDCHDVNQEPSPAVRKEIGQCSKKASSEEDMDPWLKELMASWENPIFKATEPRIPCVHSEDNVRDRQTNFSESILVPESMEHGSSLKDRISRAALQNAEVIAQVDKKFILARVLSSQLDASLLLMVDQHAADERYQVESLMQDYFEHKEGQDSGESPARTELLDRELKFDISPRDAAQFGRTANHFAYWGIQFHVSPMTDNVTVEHRQLIVTRLPPSIAERCRLEPRLLIELLRKEAWEVDEQKHHQKFQPGRARLDAGTGESSPSYWVTRFHGCPQGILDMINSRACRSSIMFNDALSQDDCVNVLKRLASCVFPFQCAHGRPSMIPLVNLGGDTGLEYDESCSTGAFSKRFKAWSARV